MKSTCISLLLVLCLLPTGAFSFDGDREGFNIGGGIGFSPYTRYSFANRYPFPFADGGETKVGLAFHAGAGHGISLDQVFRFEVNGTLIDNNTYGGVSLQGFIGVVYYHYLEFGLDTFHFLFGAGWYGMFPKSDESTNPQLGGLLGIGYNLDYSTDLTLFFSSGHSESDQLDFEHAHFSFIISRWVY